MCVSERERERARVSMCLKLSLRYNGVLFQYKWHRIACVSDECTGCPGGAGLSDIAGHVCVVCVRECVVCV